MAYFADNFSVLSLFSVSSVVKFFVFQPKRIHFLVGHRRNHSAISSIIRVVMQMDDEA